MIARPFDPRLLRVLPEARGAAARLGLLGVLSGVMAIAQAFAITALIVAVVTHGDLGRPSLALAGVLGIRGTAAAAVEFVAAREGAIVSTRLRERLLSAWLTRSADERPEPAAALSLSTAGVSAVEPYVARFLPALVAASIVPPLAIGTLIVVDWPSAVICVATVPLLPFFAALIGRATAEATAARWRTSAALGGHFLDVVRGLPTLVGYGRARHQSATIGEVSRRHRDATMATLRIAFLSSAALELLATISVAIVAVTAGVRLAGGDLPLGTALVAILVAPEAYWPIRRVGAEFHNAADGAAALDGILTGIPADDVADAATGIQAGDQAGARTGIPADAAAPPASHNFRQLSETRPETPPPMPGSPPIGGNCPEATPTPDQSAVPDRDPDTATPPIRRDLSYRYPGTAADVLHDIPIDDLTDRHPGLTVITGPSGAGKTTLLEILAGLRTPTRGHVPTRRSHLVTQRPFLTTGTLRQNLTLGVHPAPDDTHIEAALAAVDLATDIATLPAGLDTPIGDEGFGLSAGQRARLALARAILAASAAPHDEPLRILLDEPTAHLDSSSAAAAHAVITDLATRHPVVAVTHRPELVALADHRIEVGP